MEKLSYAVVANLEIANGLLHLSLLNANSAYSLTLLVICEPLESSSVKQDAFGTTVCADKLQVSVT